jgi:hypothetical protein
VATVPGAEWRVPLWNTAGCEPRRGARLRRATDCRSSPSSVSSTSSAGLRSTNASLPDSLLLSYSPRNIAAAPGAALSLPLPLPSRRRLRRRRRRLPRVRRQLRAGSATTTMFARCSRKAPPPTHPLSTVKRSGKWTGEREREPGEARNPVYPLRDDASVRESYAKGTLSPPLPGAIRPGEDRISATAEHWIRWILESCSMKQTQPP